MALAMVSIVLVLLEYLIDPDSLLRVLAHFLVYLQLIKMFLPKTPEDDWFPVLLGLTQVLAGVFISRVIALAFDVFPGVPHALGASRSRCIATHCGYRSISARSTPPRLPRPKEASSRIRMRPRFSRCRSMPRR